MSIDVYRLIVKWSEENKFLMKKVTLVYWLKIESIAITKMSKDNRYLLNKLNSIMDYLNG